jgi:serine protease Do
MNTDMRRLIPTLAVVLALGFGIAIGTVVSHGVRTAAPAVPAAEPASFSAPSPAELSNSFSRIATLVEPAVVNINTETTVQISRRRFGLPDQHDDFFDHFFHFNDPNAPDDNFQRRSLGSGVILDSRGYILTNYHVIMQTSEDKPVDRIEVNLQDGSPGAKFKARIVGADKWTDLAVIKIDASRPLAAARLGDSNSVRVGDWVLAVGSPFGLDSTVTAGIISAKGREIEPGMEGQFKHFLQTDAAINPGNSGGPLVNLAGQVIGINTAIATSQGSNDGIGFAIPSNTVRGVYNSIVAKGRVQRGAIGVTFLQQNNPALLRSFGADHGVVVNSVEKASPAERAGVKMGDVIQSVDGKAIRSGDDLVGIVSDAEVGRKLKLGLLRDGKPLTTEVEVGDRNKVVASLQGEPEGEGGPDQSKPLGGTLGVTVQEVPGPQAQDIVRQLHLSGPQGVLVAQTDPTGFASDLGVLRGDVILSVNRQMVKSLDDFKRLQGQLKSGNDVLFLIARRTGEHSYTTLYLADRLP